jgi:hypothetical protein
VIDVGHVPSARVSAVEVLNVAVTEQFEAGIEPLATFPETVRPQVFVIETNALPDAAFAVQEIEVPEAQLPAHVPENDPEPVPAVEVDRVYVVFAVKVAVTTQFEAGMTPESTLPAGVPPQVSDHEVNVDPEFGLAVQDHEAPAA